MTTSDEIETLRVHAGIAKRRMKLLEDEIENLRLANRVKQLEAKVAAIESRERRHQEKLAAIESRERRHQEKLATIRKLAKL
jgi:hypothetical protein